MPENSKSQSLQETDLPETVSEIYDDSQGADIAVFEGSSYSQETKCKKTAEASVKPARKISFSLLGPYIAAFFIPIVVMLIVFLERGIWPFGEECFLRTDLYHQYAPFHQELKAKIMNGGSLMYDWNIGGGTNFWVLMAYYLASPLSLLIAFCPQKYVIEFITMNILNKLAACSVTMTYYLNKRHSQTGIKRYSAVFFGIFYALSGYTAAYSWNIMWLDCLWLFPLVFLGLERLVKENNGLLYGVAYGLCVFTNYYISIMISLGIACYCFFLLGTEKRMLKDFGTKLLKFIGYTALGLMLASVFLLPYISYFDMTASSSGSFTFKWYSYFSVFDMISRQLLNVEVHTGLEHWPNIYCGVAFFICIPLYYLNRKITLKEKIGYTFLVLVFYYSFSTRAMDYIWHGFHIPNSLPCRQSFIYIVIVLTMGYRGFLGVKDRSYKELAIVLFGALLFVMMAEKLETDTTFYPGNWVFYGSAGFILLYGIILYEYKKDRLYKDILIVLALTLGAAEACINTSVTSVSTVKRSDYTCYDDGVRTIMSRIREEDDSAFYRVEKLALRTKNDGSWLGYPSISCFSSTANAKLTAFYKSIGLEASTNAYGATGSTPVTDMIYGIKYLISTTNLKFETEGSWLEYYDSNNSNVYMYKNKYALSLGYMLDSDVLSSWTTGGKNPLIIQNQLCELVSGVEEVFEDLTPTYTSGKTVTLTIPESGWYYAYCTKSGPNRVKLTTDAKVKTYDNISRFYAIDVGYVEEGSTIKLENVETDSTKNIDVRLYYFHEELMPEVYAAFAENQMVVDSMSDTKITAHVTVDDERTLFTTIPYEKGWTVTVDGVEMAYTAAKDAYITLNLAPGEHTLTFTFRTPYILLGGALTVLAASAFIFIGIMNRRKRKKNALVEALADAVNTD